MYIHQNNHAQFVQCLGFDSTICELAQWSLCSILLFPNVGGMTSMSVLAFIIILKDIVVSYLYSTGGDKTFIVHEYQYWSIQTYH